MVLILLAIGGTVILFDAGQVRPKLRSHRLVFSLAAATVLWTAIAVMASLNPVVSSSKLFSVFCHAVFFAAAVVAVAQRSLRALAAALIPASINAAVALSQSFGIWNPFPSLLNADKRLQTTALIGNPNDVGGYLVIPLVATVAAGIVTRRRDVWAVAVLLLAGIVASTSVTAVAATVCGLTTVLVLSGSSIGRRAAVVAILMLLGLTVSHPGARDRFRTLFATASLERLPEMTSHRLPGFTVALTMFAERPLVGVGPGVFASRYMGYKVALDERHPQWMRIGNENFGEVHNDHLQILAETGWPGYVLFLAALATVASVSFSRTIPGDDRQRWARAFAFPAVVAFFVLTLAHFSLQLTAPTMTNLYLAATCCAWATRRDESV